MKKSVLRYLLSELDYSMSCVSDFSSVDNITLYWHYWHIEFIIGLLNRFDIVVFYDDVSRSWEVAQ